MLIMVTETPLFLTIVAFKFMALLCQSQSCNNAFECVGTELVLSNGQNIYGSGYKSLYGPNTSITAITPSNSVNCFGSFACAQISFTNELESVYCYGSHSCANIDGLSYINAASVKCSGSNSCQNSNINASVKVYCYGSQSCINTNISAPRVFADGAYSLYESIIDSELVPNNILKVDLDGYKSGFGATIICRAGDKCNIYCNNNGCEMLYVECEQNSDCNILLNTNITIPPITNMSEYDHTLYDIKYDSQILSVANELCDNASNFVYDSWYEHSGIIEINTQNIGPVCCRGSDSCLKTTSIAFTDIISDIVVCSGRDSCQNTIINTTKSVFCEGSDSCRGTVINKANNVYCLGTDACYNSTITDSTNVYCFGVKSCHRSTIQSNRNDINIYLFGYDSTFNTNIYCNIGDKCHIHCGGYESCRHSTLHCNISNNCFKHCNTDTGCPYIVNATVRNNFVIPSPGYISFLIVIGICFVCCSTLFTAFIINKYKNKINEGKEGCDIAKQNKSELEMEGMPYQSQNLEKEYQNEGL